MTEISRFYGIIIRMYPEGGMYHHRPHIHVYFQGRPVTYGLDTMEPIHGELPRRQRRLLEAWLELHLRELLANWEALNSGGDAAKIDPLS
ncbi:MAG: DUF4160 domain-containing protein [Caldilineaceae bacterium]|nr:DUF4160 domain-containing protein [Caldilineaceae bacterium]